MKSSQERGIDHISDEETLALGGQIAKRTNKYSEDEKGDRIGEPPSERMQKVLTEVIEKSSEMIKTSSNKNFKVQDFEESLNLMRGAIIMAYPMGIPSWDPIYILLDKNDPKPLHQVVENCLNENSVELWWAGRQFNSTEELSTRLGHNEKTRVKCQLVPSGKGPPRREPIISEEERRTMMSLYHKRKAEAKRLAENDEDYYLDQNWANPNTLKSKLNGTENIRLY